MDDKPEKLFENYFLYKMPLWKRILKILWWKKQLLGCAELPSPDAPWIEFMSLFPKAKKDTLEFIEKSLEDRRTVWNDMGKGLPIVSSSLGWLIISTIAGYIFLQGFRVFPQTFYILWGISIGGSWIVIGGLISAFIYIWTEIFRVLPAKPVYSNYDAERIMRDCWYRILCSGVMTDDLAVRMVNESIAHHKFATSVITARKTFKRYYGMRNFSMLQMCCIAVVILAGELIYFHNTSQISLCKSKIIELVIPYTP